MTRFIGETIRVEAAGRIQQPVSFTWQGTVYQVAEIMATWHDWGHSSASTQRDWRTRRHRNYFRVRAQSGEVFEMYLDRAARREDESWILYQQLDTATGEKTP